MSGKAGKTTTGWRRRYLVNLRGGIVWLLRGKGKRYNGVTLYQVRVAGRWLWTDPGIDVVVDSEAQLVALRLQGVPVKGEPRW